MCTSIVREEPTPACPHTSLASVSLLLSSPGWEAGPALEARDFILLAVLGGNHDDHHLLVLFADLLANPHAGLPGEHQIEQDQVRAERAGQLQSLGPAHRLLHAETLTREVVR